MDKLSIDTKLSTITVSVHRLDHILRPWAVRGFNMLSFYSCLPVESHYFMADGNAGHVDTSYKL